MVRPITQTVSEEVPDEAIESMIAELRESIVEKKALRALERLSFIKMRREGVEMQKAMAVAGISKPTAYQWQNEWNDKGLDSVVPDYAGGAPRRLTDEQLERIKAEVAAKVMTTDEAQEFISREYGVKYTKKQVAVRLRGLGLHFAKPYDKDYRSPDDAEDLLKKTSSGRWHL